MGLSSHSDRPSVFLAVLLNACLSTFMAMVMVAVKVRPGKDGPTRASESALFAGRVALKMGRDVTLHAIIRDRRVAEFGLFSPSVLLKLNLFSQLVNLTFPPPIQQCRRRPFSREILRLRRRRNWWKLRRRWAYRTLACAKRFSNASRSTSKTTRLTSKMTPRLQAFTREICARSLSSRSRRSQVSPHRNQRARGGRWRRFVNASLHLP